MELIALAVALSVLPTAAAASRTSASANASQTIKFAVAFHDVQLDLGKKGPSVGDERIFADSLLDAKGRKVGHDAGVCTFTTPRTARGGLQDHVLPPGRGDRDAVPQRPAATQGRSDRRWHGRLSRHARGGRHCRRSQADRNDYLSADTLRTTGVISALPRRRLTGHLAEGGRPRRRAAAEAWLQGWTCSRIHRSAVGAAAGAVGGLSKSPCPAPG